MTIILVLGISCLITLILLSENGWSSVLSSSRNELVFENRNREYGAYQLRREYHVPLIWAMVIALSFLFTGIVAAGKFTSREPVVKTEFRDLEKVLIDITPPVTTFVIPPAATEQMLRDDPAPAASAPDDILRTVAVVTDPVITLPSVITPPTPGAGLGTGPVTPGLPAGGGGTGPSTGSLIGGGDNDKTFDYAEIMPLYPGGEEQLYRDLMSMVKYPESARQKNSQGMVMLSFVVERDGSITDVKALREVKGAPELTSAATRALVKLKPFEPAMVNGNKVRCRMAIPVQFSLQ